MQENSFGENVVLDEQLSGHKEIYIDAGQGRRLANYLIDLVVYYALSFCMGIILALTGMSYILQNQIALLAFTLCLFFAYFLVMESTTARTVGKLFTGTRVISAVSEPLTFNQVLVRSLSRMIPLEPFSFLGGTTSGWHDTLSKTRVVMSR